MLLRGCCCCVPGCFVVLHSRRCYRCGVFLVAVCTKLVCFVPFVTLVFIFGGLCAHSHSTGSAWSNAKSVFPLIFFRLCFLNRVIDRVITTRKQLHVSRGKIHKVNAVSHHVVCMAFGTCKPEHGFFAHPRGCMVVVASVAHRKASKQGGDWSTRVVCKQVDIVAPSTQPYTQALFNLLLPTSLASHNISSDEDGIPWLLPFCAAKLGGMSVSVIMVADPGAFSGSPEAMHYLNNLQHAKNAPPGSTVCAQRTTGTYVGGWHAWGCTWGDPHAPHCTDVPPPPSSPLLLIHQHHLPLSIQPATHPSGCLASVWWWLPPALAPSLLPCVPLKCLCVASGSRILYM